MTEAASLSRSIREPIDTLDSVRAWAAALGSNRDVREGEGGRRANGLSSASKFREPTVPMDVVRPRAAFGSNREAWLGDGGLSENGFSSGSSLSRPREFQLIEECVRLCASELGSCRVPLSGMGDMERTEEAGKGTA